MNKILVGLSTAASIFASINAAHAEDRSVAYNYIGANWVEFDIDGPEGSGIELIGGLGLGKHFYLQGKYLQGETDDKFTNGFTIDEADLTQYEISIGAHAPLSDHTNFFVDVGILETEVKLGSNTNTADGEVIRAGLRGLAGANFELSVNMLRQLSDLGNETGLEIGMAGYMTDNLALAFTYQNIDETEFLKFGLRMDFE